MKYELDGVGVKKLTFELIKRGDLIFFEGPVLSHFIDERGNDYFMRWCEMDDTANRWLLLQVSKEQASKHFSGKTSLLSLIKKTESGVVYFLDIDNDIEYKHIKYVEVGRIPDEYLPEKDSYFEMKYATPYARQLDSEIKEQLKAQKHSHSFWNTATVKLFGKNSVENRLVAHHSSFCHLNDPSHFPEHYVLSLIDFPLLIHRHANKITQLQGYWGNMSNHPSALSNIQSLFEHGYLFNYCDNLDISRFSSEEISTLIETILESTHNIVREHPEQYLSLYTDWKKVMVKNWNEINTIDRLLQAKFAHDEDDLASNLLVKSEKRKLRGNKAQAK